MSEFSNKLKNYIDESGYKIYSLSKESGLDKTTLQRMVGGERLPSLEFVKKLCSYLKITKLQEEELLQLFQVQKLGKDLFDTRMEIHSLLYDIQQIRENLYNETVPMSSGSFLNEEPEKVRHLSYDIDIQRVIMFIIEEELREQEKPEIFMDVFDNCRYAMRQMLHAERTGKKNIVCHQFMNLKKVKSDSGSQLDNVHMLRQIIPFAFSFQQEYDIRYSYIAGDRIDLNYQLWPHFIVAKNYVLLMTEDENEAMLFSDKEMCKIYRGRVKEMLKQYRPLFAFKGFSQDGIEMYGREINSEIRLYTYESFPCVQWLFPPETRKRAMEQDGLMGEYARLFFSLYEMYGENNKPVSIFGMRGMREFVHTGRLPGIYGVYYKAETIEERKDMLLYLRKRIAEYPEKFCLVKEKYIKMDEGIYIESYGKNKMVFLSVSSRFPFCVFSIEERGICEAFAGYFEMLLENRYLYDQKETLEKIDELIEEYMEEVRGSEAEDKGE